MDDKKLPKPRPGGIHAGHRSRIRQRFLTTGLAGFQDHEVLEFLLYYAIPRRDVNETAHLLLARFGTLAAVLDATERELCAVPGVGPGTAHFLNLIPQLMVQMARQGQTAKPMTMEGPRDVAQFLSSRLRLPLLPGETLLVLTSRANSILAVHRYDSFDQLTILEIANRITAADASLCVIIESVPDCTDFPSPHKLEALDLLSRQLAAQMTPLWDYFAVDQLGHPPRSYARRGLLLPR